MDENLPEIGDPTALERETWRNIAIASAVVTLVVVIITLLMIRWAATLLPCHHIMLLIVCHLHCHTADDQAGTELGPVAAQTVGHAAKLPA